MANVARDVADAADGFLELMLMAESDRDTRLDGDHVQYGKAAVDRLWRCDYHLIDALSERTEGADRWYLRGETEEDGLSCINNVDVALAVDKGAYFSIMHFQTIHPREVRGYVRITPQHMMVLTNGFLTKDRKISAETRIVGLVGGKWSDIENFQISNRSTGFRGGNVSVMRAPLTKAETEEINFTCSLAVSAQLTARYSWHAAFGFTEDGPRLLLPTNPKGCLSLFRDRDLNPGRNRRDALRHWVSEHWRNRPQDASQTDYVRDHLRGHTRFIWNQLDCELMVSAYDLEKNEFFRDRADQWRAQRKHNAVRLRRKVG